jgi:hypothetical protein
MGKLFLDMVDPRDFDEAQAQFMSGKRIEPHIRWARSR